MTAVPKHNNLILASLPPAQYRALLRDLTPIDMPFGEVLYEPGAAMRDVYFPVSGVVSLVSTVDGRLDLELGMVGNEGMVGLGVFLGAKSAPNRAVVQAEGSMLVMRAVTLLHHSSSSAALQRVLQRYAYSMLVQISTSAICNQFHTAEVRLARFILMMHDRVRSNAFPMTQQFLSAMLGVRREGINKAARVLQRLGLLSYRQGTIKLLSRRGLEAHACECYREIRGEHAAFVAFLDALTARSK